MRASDVGIVSPVDASVVTSGAAAKTIGIIKAAGITYYPEGSAGISRDTTRGAPYNVFADLTTIAKTAKTDGGAAGRLPALGCRGRLPRRPGGEDASRRPSAVDTPRTGPTTARATSTRTPTPTQGDEFPADTVLVLRVQVGDAGYLDPAGNPVPETKLTGKGQAMLFHDGRLVRGTWTKSDLDSPIQLSTKAGDLTVPGGSHLDRAGPRRQRRRHLHEVAVADDLAGGQLHAALGEGAGSRRG